MGVSLSYRRGGVVARCVLALGAIVSVPGALGAAGKERRPVVFQYHWWPQAQFAGYIVAKEKGFFVGAGVGEVILTAWTEGDPPLKRVSDGSVDFCTGWLSQGMKLRSQGAKVVNIGQVMQRSAFRLVTRKRSGIVKPEDMNGRRVGLWGGDFDVQPNAFFRKYGVTPEIVPQSFSIAPFLYGAVEVMSAMYYNEYHKLLEAGLQECDLRSFDLADYGFNIPEDGIYCSEATREARPELCAAVVRASFQGWAYALAHESEALDIVMKYCEEAHTATNRNHQRWMLRAMGELIRSRVEADPSVWGGLGRETYEQAGRTLSEQGVLKSVPAYAEFYRPVAASGEKRGAVR